MRSSITTSQNGKQTGQCRAWGWRSWCFVLLFAGSLALLAGVQTQTSARAQEVRSPGSSPTAIAGSVGKVSTPAAEYNTRTPGSVTPSSPDQEPDFQGWERPALHDLAEILGWPTAVAYDGAGRLDVENDVSTDEWDKAHIRAFGYSAGASAGFAAEQEDSQLSGFTVTQDTFFSYPSYTATLADTDGTVLERHYRWLAGTWILGVDVRGPQATTDEQARQVAEELLSIAVWRGLPPPPSGSAPTPNPTWALPPAQTPVGAPCETNFSDVTPAYWAYDYINRLACTGVVSGYSDGTFRPENPTTRGQLAKILILGLGWELAAPDTPSFTDVPSSHPFYSYIETAAQHGIVSGYVDGTFKPDAYVTRAQVAKMLVIAQGWTKPVDAPVQLLDVPEDYWAWPFIQAAVQHGIFSGYGDSNFRPSMLATRAQLAKVLVTSLP